MKANTTTNQQRKQKNLPSSIEGKLQPQAIEMEKAILGALLIESKSYLEIEDILTPEDFYTPAYQTLFTAIQNLAKKRKPVDMLTVLEELRSSGTLDDIGGPMCISELAGGVGSAAHIKYHALIIKQKSKARKLIRVTADIQAKCFDESSDIAETVEEMERSFTELVTEDSGCSAITMAEALNQATNKAAEVQEMKQKGIQISIPTNLQTLNDTFVGGWRAPDLIVLGARPSMGKTAHALAFAKSAAMAKKNVLFISIEMTAIQLVNRYWLEDDRVNNYNLRTGQMSEAEWQAIDEMSGKLWDMTLNIADNHNIRYLNNIKSEARRLKRKGKLDFMIIDYLGLIRTNSTFQSRQLEIGYITGELKNLCKELNIPIMLLSQLNRPIKGAAIKEPQLEDLRESGDIEQDADVVLFIHKPDYYDPDAEDSGGVKWKNRGKLIISKYREGARNNTVIFHHDDRYKKIWDTEPLPSPAKPFEPIQANTDFSNEVPF